MLKRIFDITCSLIALIVISPLLFIISVIIILNSRGSVVYRQKRVGKDGRDFTLYKFRTVFINSENNSLITVGNHDKRITSVGSFLRKYKLDELLQLYNVLIETVKLGSKTNVI